MCPQRTIFFTRPHFVQMYRPYAYEKYPLEMYQKCALVIKRVDSFLEGMNLERGEKLNLLFYVAMYSVCTALKSVKPKRTTIGSLDVTLLTDELLEEVFQVVLSQYKHLGGGDKVAKGPQLAQELKASLIQEFGQKKKPPKPNLT